MKTNALYPILLGSALGLACLSGGAVAQDGGTGAECDKPGLLVITGNCGYFQILGSETRLRPGQKTKEEKKTPGAENTRPHVFYRRVNRG